MKTEESTKADLLELLVDCGQLTSINRRQLERFCEVWKVSTFQAVIETHLMDEKQLALSLANALRLQFISEDELADSSWMLVPHLDYQRARQNSCLLAKSEAGAFFAIIADPCGTCLGSIIDVESMSIPYSVAVATTSAIQAAISRLYSAEDQLKWIYQKED